MEHYNNIVVITSDRCGSTAFIESIKKPSNVNQTTQINLAECFSQDYEINPRYPFGPRAQNYDPKPKFWNEQTYSPPQVIDAINIGTGKSVVLKCLITWANFNNSYFDIKAKRKIFLHRNMFDSTLSRCVAHKTTQWHNATSTIKHNIPEDFFISKLEWRIRKYNEYLHQILDWSNETVLYEEYQFGENGTVKKNPDKMDIVINYDNLKEIYDSYSMIINSIEEQILN